MLIGSTVHLQSDPMIQLILFRHMLIWGLFDFPSPGKLDYNWICQLLVCSAVIKE